MLRASITAWIVLLALLSAALGQSLGDVARQSREKDKSQGKSAKKIVTNEDIPESPELSPAPTGTTEKTEAKSLGGPHFKALSADQWKGMILSQKNRIASIQTQIDKLNKSIHFVEANAYTNGAQYNQYQEKKQQQVANLQTQLAEQKQKLADLQDAARKAGMGSAVYDP